MVPMRLFYGIVESLEDPLKLGRCKVRVIGVHTDDKTKLRTDDLPWATPIQGVTSAALSGVGESPTGLLNGSTVIVVFADGESAQVPLIFGTIAGIPQGNPEEFVSGDASSAVTYQTGDTTAPILSNGEQLKTIEEGGGFVAPPVEPISSGEIGPLSDADYMKFREMIAKQESGGKYTAVNTLNYMGRYQFGAAALTDFGYVVKGRTNKDLKNPVAWTGKDGITSHTKFLESTTVQDECMKKFTKQNFKILRNKGVLRNDSETNHCAGLLAVSHLKGPGDAIKYGRGEPVNPDAYGTSPEKYYKLGYASVSGEMPKVMPSDDSSLPLEVAKQTTDKGFSDPNGVWPAKKYIREPDTSRLARGQGISSTVVGKKEANRTRHVRIANSNTVWDQPHIPYATIYPYNKVRSTQGGIIEELDDSPKSIRYHLYHPAGTFTEIDNNGTTVNRIIGDKYEIIDRNGYVFIKGDCNITVEGNANILVQEKCELEVYGDCDAVIKNNLNTTIHGTLNSYVQEDVNIKCRSFNVETFDGDINMVSAKSLKTHAINDTLFESGDNIGAKAGAQYVAESGDDFSLKSGANFISESSSTFSLKAGSDLVQQSSGAASIKSSGNINMDGIEIHLQEGLSSTASSPSGTSDVIADSANGNSGGSTITDPINSGLHRQEIIDSNIAQISPPPSYIDMVNGLYESPDDGDISSEYIEVVKDILIGVGEIEMAQKVGDSSGTASQSFSGTNSLSGKVVDCSTFLNEEEIPKGMQLSDNYSLAQLSSSQMAPVKIVPQHGISVGELVCNLKHVAVNILEEVRKYYPEINVTSGLRRSGAGQAMDKNKTNISQHEKGMAVDLQFGPQYSVSDYYGIAKDLANKIDFDQIILEYSNNLRTCWVHISYNPNGNRKQLYTYNNQRKYSNDLSKLA